MTSSTRNAESGDALRREQCRAALAVRRGRWRANSPNARRGVEGRHVATHADRNRGVVRRAEREGRITAAQAVDLLSIFAQAASTWAVCEIVHDVAQRAEDGFPAEPVRTVDAIHLASALLLRHALPDLVFLSRDERVQSNARALGFEAV